MDLNRRRFLGLAGGAAGAVAAGVLGWEVLLRDHLEEATTGGPTGSLPAAGTVPPGASPAAAGRILVVLQLSGGNDGLNTLVPLGDGRYHDLRPTLGVPDDQVVALAGEPLAGLHPALAPLAPLWAGGRLAAIERIGLRNQSRSHFVAQDHWWAASDDDHETTGWLGRWLDATTPDGGTPNPLRAIALGTRSPALYAERATSTVVLDPSQFRVRAPKGADAARLTEAFRATATPLAPGGGALAAAQAAIPDALAAVDLLAAVNADLAEAGAAGAGAAGARRNQGPASMTELLGVAAGIIEHDIGTQVLIIGGDGFDTHADQATRHPRLLEDLATGVTSFLAEMDRQGRADQVLVMTTSEFGRRAAENGSGTDHGFGGVQLLFGSALARSQVVGRADLANLVEGDLAVEVDTRSLYANALDWLGGPTDEVLGGSFDRLGLLTA